MTSELFIPLLDQWPEHLRVDHRERANVREFDGGQSREEAEAAALIEVWEARNREGV